MNTKFDVGETIYIPAKVISISVSNAGVFYETKLNDDVCLRAGHVMEVPENVLLKIPDDLDVREIWKRLHPKESIEPEE